MAWGGRNRVQSQPKNQPFPIPANIFLPSLSTVSSAPEDPANTFLLHQQTAAQPPYEPKSSPVAERPPWPSVLSLCICLLLSSSSCRNHRQLPQFPSPAPHCPHQTLQPGEPPSFPPSSSSLFTMWTVGVNYNSRPPVHAGCKL